MRRLKIEWYLFEQRLLFSKRHLRYLKIGLILYLLQLRWSRRAYVLRLGFVFLQVIDDYLDGDRRCEIEPYVYIQNLLLRARKDQFLSDGIHLVGSELWRIWGSLPNGEEAKHITLALIEVMMSDRLRVQNHEIWTSNELSSHHRKTFQHSLDLTFIAIESPLRTNQLPEILDVFGWCSSQRDLDEDLHKGLCNIPLEVTEKLSTRKISPLWLQERAVQDWRNHSRKNAHQSIQICEEKYPQFKKVPGHFVFKVFIKSMSRFYALQFNQ